MKAEGIVQLFVDALHDLTDARSPASQSLGQLLLRPLRFGGQMMHAP